VVVDYLQLVKAAESDNKRKQRYEILAEQCADLKDLAKELDVPVLCLAQLGRQAVGEIPGLHHLRESGDIEALADGVLLLYQDERPAKAGKARDRYDGAWNLDAQGDGAIQPERRIALTVGKQRNGPRGQRFCLEWIPERTRFRCLGEPVAYTEFSPYADASADFRE